MQKVAAIAPWVFGKQAVEEAGRLLAKGVNSLEAVEGGIRLVELDPEVHSVGYGGYPNSEGVVELDAAVMTGRDLRVGSVAALKGFRNAVSVAKAVLEASRHPMLAGKGASLFAGAQGFRPEETLSPAAEEKFRGWRSGKTSEPSSMKDTIGLLCLDREGNLAAGCSTSGLAFKHPGRVGDSPLIGSGLYADNRAGAASATGNGDQILKFCVSFFVVELMRQGDSPMEACTKAVQRCKYPPSEMAAGDVSCVALHPSGEFGAATLRDKFPYAVWAEGGCELREVKGSSS